MPYKTPSLRLMGLLLSVSLTACNTTPDFTAPPITAQISDNNTYKEAAAFSEVPPPSEMKDNTAWWRRIGGEQLDSYVTTLLTDNLDLAQTRARITQAVERARQARGARFPALNLTHNPSTTDSNAFGTVNNYGAVLTGNFDTDIFGGLRSANRAAKLNAAAAELTYLAAQQDEITELARNWVTAQFTQARLRLAEDIADSFRQTYDLTDLRYRTGVGTVTATDVQIARQNLDDALANIPEIAGTYKTDLHTIDVQLGQRPGYVDPEFSNMEDILTLTPVTDIALGRPADLLLRRFDVGSAELSYRAALEDVGAARSQLYPNLNIVSTLTFQNGTSGSFFSANDLIISLAAALAAPLYQGGQLRAAVRLEKAEAEEISANYAQTILTAMADVESALVMDVARQEQLDLRRANVKAAELADTLAQDRYRSGLSDILTLLETQRSLNTARQNLLQAWQDRLNARIDLYRALGGDWGHVPPYDDTDTYLTEARERGFGDGS